MATRYRSSVPVRLQVSWARLVVSERALLLQLSQLPPGASHVPFENFTARDLQQLIAGMRALVSLAEECRFALGYARPPRESKLAAKESPSANEAKNDQKASNGARRR